MKVLNFAFILITYISATSAFDIKRINGVEGNVYDISFDSDSNAYVLTYDSENLELQRIYKLDAQKNVIFTMETTDEIFKTLLTNKNDFYVITWLSNFITSINVIRAGNSKLEEIAIFNKLADVHEDGKENLIIYSLQGDPGIWFLRHNSSEVISVQNLQNFLGLRASSAVITDENGNTFIEGSYWDDDVGQINFLAVITADSKETIPEGRILNGILDDPTKDYVEKLVMTSNNELLISVTDVVTIGSLKKLWNGSVSTIFEDEGYQHYYITSGKTRSLINSCDLKDKLSCRLSYLNENGDVAQILNLQNQNYEEAMFYGIEIDGEGNLFISGYDVIDQSTLEFLNHTETSTVGVDFGNFISVYDMKLDGNDNLWVLTEDGMYFIEKGTLMPEKVLNDTMYVMNLFVDVGSMTTEVFYADGSGLYVISNDMKN